MMNLLLQSSLIFVFLVGSVSVSNGEECTVTTKYGTVIGTVKNTLSPSKKVCSYLGIPFASPPVGSLRFKPPEPPSSWSTPLNATKSPNWCPQAPTMEYGVTISEDCLYLNVHQPRLDDGSTKKLPVMVWIHGGGFIQGSALPHNPDILLARGDVILVVVQYRLGLLGFLSTRDRASPGNYGLKDQAFAIRWVHENIGAFNGDPEKLTIFGQSAGSASVTFQLISPLNRGLISGAIAQSGSALASWALDRQPAESAKLMARRLGCPTSSTRMLVSCLRNRPWERIILEQGKYTLENFVQMKYPLSTMTPVVEPDLPGAFISKEPLEILKSGDVDTNIPVVLGATKHDGSFVLATLHLVRLGPLQLDKNPEYVRNEFVPAVLKFFNTEEDVPNRASASSVELAYLSGVNRTNWNESMPGFVDIFSVFAFKSSVLHTAELLSKAGSKVYLYSFEHHSNNTLFSDVFKLFQTPVKSGIAHADDLQYLFNFPKQTNNFSPNDVKFSEIFCDMWLNFGSSGNPTPSTSEEYGQWPVYNGLQDEFYMKLSSSPTVHSDYYSSWRPSGFEWN